VLGSLSFLLLVLDCQVGGVYDANSSDLVLFILGRSSLLHKRFCLVGLPTPMLVHTCLLSSVSSRPRTGALLPRGCQTTCTVKAPPPC
jgi:hypothetical protein